MVNDNFCAFILTHGRPDNVITYKTLLKSGYTGKIYIIIDDEDETADRYYEVFGDKVIMFDKKAIAETFDEGDNFDDRRAIVYARNACFDIAKDLGIKHFIQLDDDYTVFFYMYDTQDEFKRKEIKKIDRIFGLFVEYLEKSNAETLAFLQGGDIMGGGDCGCLVRNRYPFRKRKAMNSFFCSTDKPLNFIGRINEDVNTFLNSGSVGKLFMSIPKIILNQKQTQSNDGGMTDIYVDSGTYIKSFYAIIFNPSCVVIHMMGRCNKRLHHQISWANAVPVILDEKYKINKPAMVE